MRPQAALKKAKKVKHQDYKDGKPKEYTEDFRSHLGVHEDVPGSLPPPESARIRYATKR